jgi:8-oxo-dGTP pyrophosphatase MutT (NUDIX family)
VHDQEEHAAPRPDFQVVAAVLTHQDRICLLRRSALVSSDAGLWHCVTGYLPVAAEPIRHAQLEVAEETGIAAACLETASAVVIDEYGPDGRLWRIHTFHFRTATAAVNLNWEHDAACWVSPDQMHRLPTVRWFGAVLRALSIGAAPCGACLQAAAT